MIADHKVDPERMAIVPVGVDPDVFRPLDDVDQDLYIDKHGQLDFKTSYDFNDQWTAFIQFQNLTDEPLRYFSGSRSRMAENEIYSWNVLAGFSMKF